MEKRPRVPVRHRRVSNELRALRKKASFTCKEVAEALDWSITKVSRMETGKRGLYVDDVAALLGLYRVPTKKREELLALVRQGADRNWQRLQIGRSPICWEEVSTLESDASALHNFEALIVPGLLQIPEYSRAIIRELSGELSDAEVDVLVARRMARSAILAKASAPRLHVIIDEAVLRRPIGGVGVMCRQFEHLIGSASMPNVRVQVVPFAAGIMPGVSGSFLMLDFAEHPSLIYLEHREATAFLEDEEHIQRSRAVFRRLRDVALAPDESLRFIAGVAAWMGRNDRPSGGVANKPNMATTTDREAKHVLGLPAAEFQSSGLVR